MVSIDNNLERVIFTQEEIDSIKLAFENINISNNQDFINEEYIKKYKYSSLPLG